MSTRSSRTIFCLFFVLLEASNLQPLLKAKVLVRPKPKSLDSMRAHANHCSTVTKGGRYTSHVLNLLKFDFSGPEHWPGVCQTGERQSPVDLVGPFKRLDGEPLSLDGAYKKNTAWIASWDGHAYVATMANPSETAILDGGSLRDAYIFKSLHVHWGAEHTIKGSRCVT